MPGLVSSVGKGNNFAELDRWLQEPTQDKLDLLRGGDLHSVASQGGLLGDEAGRHHVEDEALGDSADRGSWWPDVPHKAAILRSALIRALEIALAGKVRKSVRTYWVRGMNGRMEAYILEHDHDIVVLWMTPDVPEGLERVPPAGDNQERTEDITAIAENERIRGYVRQFDGLGYQVPEPEDPTGEGVVLAWRVIGY